MENNGGSVIAMVGKDCVAIASDLRLGNQAQGIATNFQKVRPSRTRPCRCIRLIELELGVSGNRQDISWATRACNGRYNSVRFPRHPCSPCALIISSYERFRFRTNMYTIKEEREISPETFTHLVSSTLYEHRFGPYFIEPVIAGLSSVPTSSAPASSGASAPPSGKKWQPFIAATDLIGCINFAKDFVVAGTASSTLFGVAEGLWEPDLEPEDLFETISQTMLNALDRDAYSGWGVVVHVM
jgi:20S proteasome subunit beta 3